MSKIDELLEERNKIQGKLEYLVEEFKTKYDIDLSKNSLEELCALEQQLLGELEESVRLKDELMIEINKLQERLNEITM